MSKKKLVEEKSEEISHIEKPIELSSKESEIKEIQEKEIPTNKEVRELREKIEKTDLDDHLKVQVQSHVNDVNSLAGENRLKKLMEIAKIKGVIFAVNIAKKMNDPYILDMLHDSLAKEGYYKNFKL